MAINTLTERAIEFTSKDFESWLVELRTKATAVFPQWTDFNRANIGNLMLELFAHTLDIMTYCIDQQTNEAFIPTARQRRSMIDLGKLVAYELPGATEASVNLEFTIADGQARSVDITIPALTQVTAPDAENPQSFWTTAAAVITQGNIQVTGVAARNAEPQEEAIATNGTASQEIRLAQTPYLDNSAQVEIGGDTYTEVESLLTYGPSDKVFRVMVDENNVGVLIFGDGVNGYAPNGAGNVTYETGGGESGNVEPNTINEIQGTITDATGQQVQMTVRNPSDAGGGTDRMSVEEARVAIPESVHVANLVTCSRDQFEINARNVRGVARSLVLVHDDDTTIPEYTAYVYIVPTGGGLPSATLKAEVLNEITVERPQPVGMDVYVYDPVLNIISISATVYLEEGTTESEARTNIESSLDDFFALTDANGVVNPLINFGFHVKNWQGTADPEVPWSDLFNAVRDATGIRKVDKTTFTPSADVTLLNNEFPVLGSITLTNGDTGSTF
jgi:hypothetical protein